MKLQGDYLFEAPIDQVWQALLDPVVLAAVMPGCERLDLVDGQYVGELNVKVGPVQGKFNGKVELKDMVPPQSYTMNVDGRGPSGFVKAAALVQLAAEGELSEHTRMRYDADAQVGGKIASVGQRLLEASARAISKQSLDGLNENIKLRAAAAAEQAVRAKSAAALEAAKPEPPVSAPVVLKRVDQTALAASIAKEVTKSLLPPPFLIGIGVGIAVLVIWLVAR